MSNNIKTLGDAWKVWIANDLPHPGPSEYAFPVAEALVKLKREKEYLASVIDSNNFPDTAAKILRERENEIEQLSAANSALERECERLRGEVERLTENNAHLHVRVAEKEQFLEQFRNWWIELTDLTGAGRHLSVSSGVHRAACQWVREKRELSVQLPRIAEAVSELESKLAERKALLDSQWVYPIIERLGAILATVAAERGGEVEDGH